MTSFEKYMKNEHAGRENAIKSKALESIFRCKGKEIRHMVNELRCLGVPICSCNEGYFYSTNASDIRDTKLRPCIHFAVWCHKAVQQRNVNERISGSNPICRKTRL